MVTTNGAVTVKIPNVDRGGPPPALSVDLTAIGSEGVRQSVRDALGTIGYDITEYESFWAGFTTGETHDIPTRLLVFSDLSKLIRRFMDSDRHQWISSVRRNRPYFVTYVRTKYDQKYADLVDDLLHASDLRVLVCRETAGAKVRQSLEEAVAYLDPDSLAEVRYSGNGSGLWVAFGDGLSGEISWDDLGISDELPRLIVESATPARGAKAVEMTTHDGGLFHIDSTSIRALIDPRLAQILADDADRVGVELGDRLRKARVERGITQQELGKRSGLAQALISKLEGGKHQPRFDTLQRYATGLNLSVEQLLV